LGESLTGVQPEDMPTHRADLYRELLNRDGALAKWVQEDSGEIRVIYGLAFNMINEGRRVLEEGELASLVRTQVEAQQIQDPAAVQTVLDAIRRSRMFAQEKEQNIPGLSRIVVRFQHELMGKYLAACYLLPFVGKPRDEVPVNFLQLSNDPKWFDVFCFIIDKMDSSYKLNFLLNELLEDKTSLRLQLVGYAIGTTSPDFIDRNIREDYFSAKVQADLQDPLAG